MEFKNISRQLGEIAKNYDYQQPPDLLIKLQDFIAYVLRMIRELLGYLHMPQFNTDSRGVATVMQVLVVIAGLVAVVMVLVLVASKLKSIARQRQLALGTGLVSESPLDSRGWSDLGQELAAKQAYKEACRAVYMSILHTLDEEKIIAFSLTKTNYEYFYALKHNPSIATAFRKLVDLVEYIWFGEKRATEADYQECLAESTLVRQGLAENQKANVHTGHVASAQK